MTRYRTLSALALLGLLSVSTAACSQSRDAAEPAPAEARGARGGDPGARLDRQMASLREAVDLTDAQAEEIRAIFEAQAAERPRRGARGQRGGGRASGDRAAMREAMQARRAEIQRQIEALLTPEQTEAFRAWSAEQAERRRGRRGGRDRGGL